MLKSTIKKLPKNVDEYFDTLPGDKKELLDTIRQTVKKMAPGAEEVISYGMPAFRYHGMLLYYAAFQNHCSLFPGNASLIKEFKEELQSFKTNKGTIQFTVEHPLPISLVKKIVKIRMKENEEKWKMKNEK